MHESAWGRLIAVLISPVRTFESIAVRPTWVAPLIVLMILSATAGVLAWQRVDVQQIQQETREAMVKQGREATQDQLDQAVDIGRGIGTGCSVVMPAISYLIAASVLLLMVKLAGGEIGFPGSLSVTLHGLMPWGVAALLAVPVVLSQQTIDLHELRRGLPIASSAAAFAPEGTSEVLLALLGSLDVFSFWTLGLLIIGFSAVAKISRGKAAGAVLSSWLIWILFKLALAWVGTMFGGGAG